ncbi:DUF982 domain-containing protein [Agrobacterium pusense]|uniref:DUF982 domain-containing protein n=1 Tax=Agrobacterium pusense TaxID=648995 RepID=UPI003C7B5179
MGIAAGIAQPDSPIAFSGQTQLPKESVFPAKAPQSGFFQHRRNTLSSHSMATANFGKPVKLAALRSSIPILMPCLRQAPHKRAKICVTRAWRLAVASGFWDSTVTIEIGGKSTAYARITTTRGAASYLIEQWPGSRDQSYKEAIVSCTRALKGELNDEAVFASFVKAVRYPV